MTGMHSIGRGASALVGLFAFSATVAAAEYPERPIRMVVPFASGSNIDITARQIMPRFSEYLGQQVVVDNRAGAGGTIGASLVAKATPDGYTLLMGNAPTHGLAPSMYKDLPYDPVRSFAPIVRISTQSFVLAVSASLPVKSVSELVKYAKSRPRQLNYASSGNGTTAHLSGALFNIKAGVELVHIPYNSVPQALIDLGSGAVAVMFYPYQPLTPMLQQGRIRLLAATGARRLSYLPDLPTVKETGIADFTAFAWHGFYAPEGTPKPIVDKLYAALAKAVKDPRVAAHLQSAGVEVDVLAPADFAEFTKAQVERYRQIVALAAVKVD
ncbi:MAG TPA: tripartite tricarboxylate transporter substrate binding protein [Burkholderiales bacterium]|nr:tripartite tricarboxylate transporter substrate binding protein [Burkholderiales bacterium]